MGRTSYKAQIDSLIMELNTTAENFIERIYGAHHECHLITYHRNASERNWYVIEININDLYYVLTQKKIAYYNWENDNNRYIDKVAFTNTKNILQYVSYIVDYIKTDMTESELMLQREFMLFKALCDRIKQHPSDELYEEYANMIEAMPQLHNI